MDSFPYIKREHWEKMGQVHILFISFYCSKRAFSLVSSNLIFLGRIVQIKNFFINYNDYGYIQGYQRF